MDRHTTGLIIIAIGILGLLIHPFYAGFDYCSMSWQRSIPSGNSGMGQQDGESPPTVPPAPVTIDEARNTARQYLTSLGNPNLAIKEIMEFQHNFYIIYYEKDTGRGAFEMLIWKQVPSDEMTERGMGMGGMMNGYGMIGVIMPELGPNMMWNSKYSPMRNGMMGISNQGLPADTVSSDRAVQLAQEFLNTNLSNAKVETGTHFYGYYSFDFTVNGKIAGMLSVNTSTGDVLYHSWHGGFIQEFEYD